MEKIINFYYDISTYLMALPLVVGFYYWRKLGLALKFFLIASVLSFIISCFSQYLAAHRQSTHFLYYLMIILSAITYSFFYNLLINFRYSKIVFWSIPIFFMLYLGIDYWRNGLQLFFSLPFLLLEIIFLPCSIFLLINERNSQPVRVMNWGILINFCSDIPLTITTTYLFKYFQGKAFQMVFFGLSPIFTLIFLGFQTYAFYLAGKQITPEFDNIKDFQ